MGGDLPGPEVDYLHNYIISMCLITQSSGLTVALFGWISRWDLTSAVGLDGDCY